MTPKLPVFDSISQCSGATGIPINVIRQAKRAGCPAFSSNRVALGPLLKWLFERNHEDGIDWGSRLKEFKAKREELRHGEEAGKLIQRTVVCEAFQRLGGEVHGIRVISENEDPLLFAAAGGDVALCRTQIRKMWDRILTQFQETSKHFDGL